MDKIGLREPYGATSNMKYVYDENTGMEYEQYSDQHGNLYMTACHEAVGLSTWYRITENDWDQLSREDKE